MQPPQTTNMPPQQQASQKQQLTTLLSATLETWCHLVLYLRGVYPRVSFGPTRFLGISSCQACRHSGVVEYIDSSLQVIVPSILSGAVTQLSLVIMKDAFTVSETFTLGMTKLFDNDDNSTTNSIQEMERTMRDLVLSTLSLEGLSRKKLTDDAFFKLTLKTADTVETNNCPELNAAFQEGKWYEPSPRISGRSTNLTETTSEEDCEETIRPLYHSSLSSGGSLEMNLISRRRPT